MPNLICGGAEFLASGGKSNGQHGHKIRELTREEAEFVAGGGPPFQGTFYGPNYIVNVAIAGSDVPNPDAYSAVTLSGTYNLGGANGPNG